ncbi:SLBB domain-containing protein [Sphingomonas turrisvirgatae]|uniref:SLBB domain-containing protein n=1 Tax=Sphingomonas turrisvirgatae TaxID=1888892 RepID=UPI00156AC73B|nr:SLBB domain-containing protein [Sphingomonas turrisvirgatae]
MSLFKRWIAACLMAVAVTTVMPAAAQTPVAPPASATASDPARNTVERERYILGRGDVVEVSVIGRPEYLARVQIQEDGTILLPFINNVPAAGRSVLELRNQVRGELVKGQYFADPAVNVTVVSFASRYVTVLGQVRQPGVVPIDRSYRVSEIIARAGGVASDTIDTITLTRPDGKSVDLSLRRIATAGPEGDPMVADGDKVYVAPAKVFYINGQVNKPGTYPIVQGMTVQMALSYGGGLTAIGSSKRVKITRGSTELARVKPTEIVQPDDVIVVGERFF